MGPTPRLEQFHCALSVHVNELFPTDSPSACLSPGTATESVSSSQNTLLPKFGFLLL